MDWKLRQGELKGLTGRKFPRGFGHDFAGIVDVVGPNVTRFKVSDEVFGATELKEAGAFAEDAVYDAQLTPQSMAGILEAAGRGKLAPKIGRVVLLPEAIPALGELEQTGSPREI